jgi:hypothetical protein
MSTVITTLKGVFAKHGALLKKHGIKLSVAELKFVATASTSDGIDIMSPDDEFAVGSEVFYNDADGNPVPLADGTYSINDGATNITVADGVITEIQSTDSGEPSSEELAGVISDLSQRLSDVEAKLAGSEAKLSAATKRAEAAEEKLRKAPAARSVKQGAHTPATLAYVAPEKPFAQMTIQERVAFNLAKKKAS